VEKFHFDDGAGSIVPGYLLLPKGAAGKAPAILYCHWHGGEYDNGKEELFRAEHTPVPPGPTLARHGYVVLGVDACCFGERNGKGPGGPEEKGSAGEMTASKFNLWVGRTLWGMILRDDLMALDYLASRPEVDSQRIGVTGISMGATRSWWLMALDDRLKAGVAVTCLTRYQNLIAHEGLKYHGIYYFVPGMLNHFDTEAVVGLAAPRPLLFQTGDKDEGSPVDGVREIEAKVRPIYQLYDAAPQFQSIVYPGVGHVYLPEMWQRTMSWMDEKLSPK
jgi:dienelactone hydrolase